MSSKENSRIRSKSTARKINRMWTARLFGIFLSINLICMASLFIAFIYHIETEAFGQFSFTYLISTHTKHSDGVQKYVLTISDDSKDDDRIEISYSKTPFQLEYRVTSDDSDEVYSDLTIIIEIVKITANVIVISELIILVLQFLFGAKAARKQLQPLDKMAQMASKLGSQTEYEGYERYEKYKDPSAAFNEAKVHDLEDAIAKIKPNAPDGMLHTGDADLKDLEDSINGLLERMRDSYRQQSQFVSDASHELRTPIAVIQGYVNMLDRWGKNDTQVLAEGIEAIKNESDHMKKLVEQLLFLARGDSGRNQFVLEEKNMNDIVSEVYEESSMIDENHEYQCSLADESIIVYVDPSMMKQAIRILIENASKYTKEKERIKIGCGMDEQRRPYVYVQDNGRGIDSTEMKRIFERFYRADEARQSQLGGTGLGLSIAKWIVDRHGGYFEVLSEQEIGTRITIVLPQEFVYQEWMAQK